MKVEERAAIPCRCAVFLGQTPHSTIAEQNKAFIRSASGFPKNVQYSFGQLLCDSYISSNAKLRNSFEITDIQISFNKFFCSTDVLALVKLVEKSAADLELENLNTERIWWLKNVSVCTAHSLDNNLFIFCLFARHLLFGFIGNLDEGE